MNDAIALANQSIKFASREASGAAGGLMEWFLQPDTRTRRERLMEDWLDFNGADMGYALGLLIYISSTAALIFAPMPICWYFA